MFLLSVILIFTIVVSSVATNWIINNSQKQSLSDMLNRTGEIIDARLNTQSLSIMNQSRLVGELPILSIVVEDGHAQTITDTSKSYRDRLQLPIFDVTSYDGSLITSLDDSFPTVEDDADSLDEELVSHTLDTGQTLSSLISRNGKLALIGVAPIGIDYEPSGVLIVGDYLNDDFATKIRKLSKADISFVYKNQVTGSSLSVEEQQNLLGTVQKARGRSRANRDEFINIGTHYVRLKPLENFQGETIGQAVIQISLKETTSILRNIRNGLVGIGVLVFLASGVLGWVFLTQSLAKPVEATANMLQDIAQGEGDLTKRIKAQTQDEVGQLAEWFNTFIDKLRGIIQQVARATAHIASTAIEMSLTAEQIATGSDKIAQQSQLVADSSESVSERASEVASFSEEVAMQAVEVTASSEEVALQASEVSTSAEEVSLQAERIARSTEELSESAEQISRNCSDVVQAANTATQASQRGQDTVVRTIDEMNRVAARVHESARVIETLHARSGEIGEIVEVINEITEQTNLLALNAAIEAARAGENGRGFAVVAEEIRKLAEVTTQSTQRISDMVEAIQTEAQNAFVSMENGVRQVEAGTKLASRAGTDLETITEQVALVTDMITQVSGAVEEQRKSTDSIAQNIQQVAMLSHSSTNDVREIARLSRESTKGAQEIARLSQEQTKGMQRIAEMSQKSTASAHEIAVVSQQSASGAQQSAHAISELAELADHLQQLVGQFKLDTNESDRTPTDR